MSEGSRAPAHPFLPLSVSLADEKIRSSAWPQAAFGILSLPVKHFFVFLTHSLLLLSIHSCIQLLGPVARQAGTLTSSVNELRVTGGREEVFLLVGSTPKGVSDHFGSEKKTSLGSLEFGRELCDLVPPNPQELDKVCRTLPCWRVHPDCIDGAGLVAMDGHW